MEGGIAKVEISLHELEGDYLWRIPDRIDRLGKIVYISIGHDVSDHQTILDLQPGTQIADTILKNPGRHHDAGLEMLCKTVGVHTEPAIMSVIRAMVDFTNPLRPRVTIWIHRRDIKSIRPV